MTIEIKKPELEELIKRLLDGGSFHDIDELLTKALEALPQEPEPVPQAPRKRLIDVLMSEPFAGSGLKIDRIRERLQQPIEL